MISSPFFFLFHKRFDWGLNVAFKTATSLTGSSQPYIIVLTVSSKGTPKTCHHVWGIKGGIDEVFVLVLSKR